MIVCDSNKALHFLPKETLSNFCTKNLFRPALTHQLITIA